MLCTVGVRFPLFRPSLRPEGDWNMCMFYVAGIIYLCMFVFWLKCYCIWTFVLVCTAWFRLSYSLRTCVCAC